MSLVGNLEDLGLGDILQIVSLSRKSGVLNLAWGEVRGKIVFRDGQVVVAYTTEQKPSLPGLLSGHGALAPHLVDGAERDLERTADAQAARKLMLSSYNLKPDLYDETIREQIEATVFHFFSWPEGTFNFELQEIDGELKALKSPYHAFVIEPGLSPQFLAMEGTRLQDEQRRKKWETPVGPPRKTEAAPEPEKAAPPPPPPPPPPRRGPDAELPKSHEVEEDFSSVAEALAYYDAKAGAKPAPPPQAQEEEIPMEVETPPQAEPAASPSPPPAVAGKPADKKEAGAVNLMIIDDEPFVLESISHHLRQKDLTARTFGDVGGALVYIQETTIMGLAPKAILADLIMPDPSGSSTLGGLTVLEQTRKINPGIPVILMTDYENLPARKRAEELGAKFFLTKPKSSQLDDDFGSPELLNFVQVLLNAIETSAPRPAERPGTPAALGGKEEVLVNLGDELRREFGEDAGAEPMVEQGELTPSRGLAMLKAMISELNDPGANGQITLLILRFASELMNRAVIFLVAKNQLAGLGQFGIEIEGRDPQKHVRSIRIPLNQPSIFREAIQKRMPLKKGLKKTKVNDFLVEMLGGREPAEVFVAPIIAGGRIAALIYGDNIPDHKEIGDTESLEIFLAQAGLAMEKALLERRLKEIGREPEA